MVSLKTVSEADRELIETFVTKYNAIDHHLRAAVGRDASTPFSAVLVEATRRQLVGRAEADALRVVGELRNILTRAKIAEHGYPAVPTMAIVETLDRIYSSLRRPMLAIPAFKRDVETVTPSDSLTSVLGRVRKCNYSQFPVYEGTVFRGLLTENGIIRWLADHLATDLSLVEFDDIKVSKSPGCSRKRRRGE